jgi:hypothetical protein
LFEDLVGMAILKNYATEGDQHFPFLVDMAKSAWRGTNFAADERRRNEMNAFVDEPRYVLRATELKEVGSEEFIPSFLRQRDASDIAVKQRGCWS